MSQKQGSSHKTSNTRRSERKRRNYRANLEKRYRLHAQRCKLIRSDLQVIESQIEVNPGGWGDHVARFALFDTKRQVERALAKEETKRAKCERLIDGRR